MTRTNEPLPRHQYTDEEMHNVDMAHEHSDANIRALLAFAAAMTLVVAVSAGLMLIFFVVLEKQAEKRDPAVSPLAVPAGEIPQGPRLLTNEPHNLRMFREEEQRKLEGYSWMNQSQGIAHIPIDTAKKLVVQHGLPSRADAANDPTEGTHAPAYGEASGGRTIPVNRAAAGQASSPGAGQQQQPPPPTPAQQGAAPEIKK